jgi:hypothetical protein
MPQPVSFFTGWALRTGDLEVREKARPLAQELADGIGLTRSGRWSLAVESSECGLPLEAYEHAALAIATMREATPSMTTPSDFADHFILTHLCDVAGDLSSLEVLMELTQERFDLNPDNALVSAIASAVRGVRDHSCAELLIAAEQMRTGCRPLVLATLLEGAGV